MAATPAASRLKQHSLAAWDAAGLGEAPVHVVSLKPLLARFYDLELHESQPNRAAADAVTAALQKGRRRWAREEYADWTVQLALPWTAGGGAGASSSTANEPSSSAADGPPSPRHRVGGRPGNNPRGPKATVPKAVPLPSKSLPVPPPPPPPPVPPPAEEPPLKAYEPSDNEEEEPEEEDAFRKALIDASSSAEPFNSPVSSYQPADESPPRLDDGPSPEGSNASSLTARSDAMSDRSDKSAASVEAASTSLLSDRSSASVRQPRLNLPSSATAAAAAAASQASQQPASQKSGGLFDRSSASSRPSPRGPAKHAKPPRVPVTTTSTASASVDKAGMTSTTSALSSTTSGVGNGGGTSEKPRPAWDDRTNPNGELNGRDMSAREIGNSRELSARGPTPREERLALEAARAAAEAKKVETVARAKAARMHQLTLEAEERDASIASWAHKAADELRAEVSAATSALQAGGAAEAARRKADAEAAAAAEEAAAAGHASRSNAAKAFETRLKVSEGRARAQAEASEGNVPALERKLAKEARARAKERRLAIDDAEGRARQLRRKFERQAAEAMGITLEEEEEDDDEEEEGVDDEDGDMEVVAEGKDLWKRLRRVVRAAAREAEPVEEEEEAEAAVDVIDPKVYGSRFETSGRAAPPAPMQQVKSAWAADGARFEISGRAAPPSMGFVVDEEMEC